MLFLVWVLFRWSRSNTGGVGESEGGAGRPGETPIPIPHWNQTLSSMPCNTAMTQSVGASYNRYHIQMVMYESAKNRKGQSGIVDKFAFLWCLLCI